MKTEEVKSTHCVDCGKPLHLVVPFCPFCGAVQQPVEKATVAITVEVPIPQTVPMNGGVGEPDHPAEVAVDNPSRLICPSVPPQPRAEKARSKDGPKPAATRFLLFHSEAGQGPPRARKGGLLKLAFGVFLATTVVGVVMDALDRGPSSQCQELLNASFSSLLEDRLDTAQAKLDEAIIACNGASKDRTDAIAQQIDSRWTTEKPRKGNGKGTNTQMILMTIGTPKSAEKVATVPERKVSPEGSWRVADIKKIKPSFDCGKAVTSIEMLICSDEELANADVTMVKAYNDAVAMALDPVQLRKQQLMWLYTKRSQCSGISCLREVYQERIAELRSR